MSYTNLSVSFNGTDLTSISAVSILATNPYILPKRSLNMSDLARTNNSKVSTSYYSDKQITIRVNIVGPTRDDVEQSLDQLTALLQPIEKDLVVRQSKTTRRYTASYSDYAIIRDGGAYLELDIVFVCSDRFGYDLNPTQITNQAGLTSTYNAFSWTQGGSADTQAPTITIQYTAIGNSGSNGTVTINNPKNSQSLVISRVWTAGDMLIVDCRAGTVKVNGSNVSFTGPILSFGTGRQYFNVTDNFTSRTMNINALVFNRYI